MEDLKNVQVDDKQPLIYVVDDDAVRRTMMRIVQKMKLPVEIRDFDSAVSLLKAIENGAAVPAVVISDYQMPEMKGDVLCEKLQALSVNGKPPTVLILTGSNIDLLRSRFEEVGAKYVFAKPIDKNIISTIENKIREVLAGL